MRRWMTEMLRESFQQGSRTAALEAALYRRPWGFRPEQVYTETLLWYGGADETVPASVGQWLADRLPDSDLTIWPEQGHFTWMRTQLAADVIATVSGCPQPGD